MKILLVANAQSIHTRRWAEFFRDSGDEVQIASFYPDEIPGVPVHVLPQYGPGRAAYIFGVPAVRRLWKQLRPDVVQAHYLTSYGFISAAAGIKPLVVTAWGDDILLHPDESWLKRQLVGYAVRHADLVTTVALHMNRPVEALGVPAERIVTIPFGVDVERFHPAAGNKRGEKTVHLICTRNFDPIYDLGTLIRALALLPGDLTVQTVMVGEGPLRPEMMALAASLGLEDRISFPGKVGHNVLPRLLAEADLFVTPALSDGNNVSLTEAMACGTFPIASDIPANRQWIRDGENGYLYPCSDAAALADRIVRAAADREKLVRVLPENRKIVETMANWERCGMATRALLEGLAANSRNAKG